MAIDDKAIEDTIKKAITGINKGVIKGIINSVNEGITADNLFDNIPSYCFADYQRSRPIDSLELLMNVQVEYWKQGYLFSSGGGPDKQN